MGPGMGAGRARHVSAANATGNQATERAEGLERLSVSPPQAHRTELGDFARASDIKEVGGEMLRRGFTTLGVLRGLNLGLTGTLSVMNFAMGRPGLGLLWGGVALMWGALALAGRGRNEAGDGS